MKAPDPRSLPLLAADPVALAIAEGRQRQHRQPMKPQPTFSKLGGWSWVGSKTRFCAGMDLPETLAERLVPFAPWRVGDSLYVRQCWGRERFLELAEAGPVVFRADYIKGNGRDWWNESRLFDGRWRPNIHMPEKLARTRTKPLTRVWVERVQDISEEDARAEGFMSVADYQSAMDNFYPGCTLRNDWLWCCAWDGVEVRT